MNPTNKKPSVPKRIPQRSPLQSAQVPQLKLQRKPPVAPPVYKPEAPKLVQPKGVTPQRKPATAPPPYRPELKRTAQLKTAPAARPQQVIQRSKWRYTSGAWLFQSASSADTDAHPTPEAYCVANAIVPAEGDRYDRNTGTYHPAHAAIPAPPVHRSSFSTLPGNVLVNIAGRLDVKSAGRFAQVEKATTGIGTAVARMKFSQAVRAKPPWLAKRSHAQRVGQESVVVARLQSVGIHVRAWDRNSPEDRALRDARATQVGGTPDFVFDEQYLGDTYTFNSPATIEGPQWTTVIDEARRKMEAYSGLRRQHRPRVLVVINFGERLLSSMEASGELAELIDKLRAAAAEHSAIVIAMCRDGLINIS